MKGKQLRIIDDPSDTQKPTTYSLARTAVTLYPRAEYTDRKAVNALRRGWIRGIEYLGDRWILAKANHICRRQAGAIDVDAVIFVATVSLFIWSLFIGVGV